MREFLDAERPSERALVLTGGPGIGKTTLWEAAIEASRTAGRRLLSARPSSAEAGLPFAALIDLCETVDGSVLSEIPAPQRRALEVALLRAEPQGEAPEPQAIALGFLGAARALAAEAALMIAIDDVQWLDASSADALVFAVRRLSAYPVTLLLARRPDAPSTLERALEHNELQHMEVGPLSLGATRALLAARLGLSVPRQVLRRITEFTLGNPLFVLEVGRVLRERGIPRIGDDFPVPDGIEDVLGTRVAALSAPVRRLLLALALGGELRLSELLAVSDRAALDDAIDARLLVTGRDRARPSHPLLAAAAMTQARRSERRELHLALAGAVTDPPLRALHLALASADVDPDLADAVAAAARTASARGARQQAAELAGHALRLTPADAPERSERVLWLGGLLYQAGELQALTELLRPELASLPAGRQRARAWLLLCEGAGPRNLTDLTRHLDLALSESDGEPLLRAEALAQKSCNASAGAIVDIHQAEAWAQDALDAATEEGGPVEQLARYALCWARGLTGRPIDDLCAAYASDARGAMHIATSPERVAGQQLVWRGELAAARTTLTRLQAAADEQGDPTSYALARLHVCELDLRAGDWDAADRLLEEWGDPSERELLVPPMYERCRALLAAGRGQPEEAERWATEAIARARATESRWDELEALRARGVAALLARGPAAALESFQPVWEHTIRERVDELGVFPVAPDLVEALAEAGAIDEARGVSRRLRELAVQQEHPWGLATAERCEALLALSANGYSDTEAARLAHAADAYCALGLRFDAARCLLSLGRMQRRLKKWGAARESLGQAGDAFESLGSAGWAEQARAEDARVGGRRAAASGELTPTERRVAALAADGLSNQEIAHKLFITVHTVEVHLSRVYAKLGVRSRGQLARHRAIKD